MPKTNAEVANKVRTEMTKEKLLKQFKDFNLFINSFFSNPPLMG